MCIFLVIRATDGRAGDLEYIVCTSSPALTPLPLLGLILFAKACVEVPRLLIVFRPCLPWGGLWPRGQEWVCGSEEKNKREGL